MRDTASFHPSSDWIPFSEAIVASGRSSDELVDLILRGAIDARLDDLGAEFLLRATDVIAHRRELPARADAGLHAGSSGIPRVEPAPRRSGNEGRRPGRLIAACLTALLVLTSGFAIAAPGPERGEKAMKVKPCSNGKPRRCATGTPVPLPSPTPSPEPTSDPDPKPEPTHEPEPSPEPDPSAEPEPNPVPEPSGEPEPTAEPELSVEPTPSGDAEPSRSPEPTSIADPTGQGTSPVASIAPSVSTTIAPSPSPSPSPSASPSPSPSPSPCAGVPVPPGSSIQAFVEAYPAGTTFCLSGRYELASPVSPRESQTFRGPAVIVAASGNHTGFYVTRRYVRFIDLDMSGFAERAIRCMYGTRIIGGRYHHNGINGFGCGLSRSSGGGVVVDGVEVDHNGSPALLGHSSSGIKLAGSPGSVIRNSYVHDNIGNGIWFDVDSGGDQLDVVENNVVIGNTYRGIFYEVSRGPVLIRGNVVTANNTSGTPGASGIGVSSSKNVTITGNILSGNRLWEIRANQIDRGYELDAVVIDRNVLNGGAIYGCGQPGVVCSANV